MSYSAFERRPTYELLEGLPYQGEWSETDYLELGGNRLVELSDGFLEFLPMPDEVHFEIQNFIFLAVTAILAKRGKGIARYAPFKVRVADERFREPDICLLLDENDKRRARQYWSGADFVVEVVSPDNPERDYWKKRDDYAAAGIAEYWIVDPAQRRITLLKLQRGAFVEHGVFKDGDVASSLILEGLSITVSECFAAADRASKVDRPSQT